MSTQAITSTNTLQERSTAYKSEQYSLWQILGIWASAVLPMGLSYWVIVPLLLSGGKTYPFAYPILMTTGMVWQGILAYILLRREVKPFTWQGVKDRLWLHAPSSPKTGVRSKWLLLWAIPCIALSIIGFDKLGWLNDLWLKVFPFLAQRSYSDIHNLADAAVGQWWLVGLFALELSFNYLLGEELIFRGILLPKMNGVLASGTGSPTIFYSWHTICICSGTHHHDSSSIACMPCRQNSSSHIGWEPSFMELTRSCFSTLFPWQSWVSSRAEPSSPFCS